METINTSTKIKGAWESMQGGRAENQDFLGYADTSHGFLLVLCDGMGGGPGGRTASSSTVEFIINYIKSYPSGEKRKDIVRNAILLADRNIQSIVGKYPQLNGMGTTCVVLLINEISAVVAHVGDSRLYQFRFGNVVFRSADHSRVGELVRRGILTEEQARMSADSNIITRAINGRNNAEPDVYELAYERGDKFMLCSDGIWGMFPEKNIIRMANSGKDILGVVSQMANDVNKQGIMEGGHHDNLTIAIVETSTNSKKKVKMTRKSRRIIMMLAAVLLLSVCGNVALFFGKGGNANETEKLSVQLDSVKKENSRLDGELKGTKSSLNEALGRADASKQDLLTKNVQLRDSIASLKSDVSSLRNQLAESKKEAAVAKTTASHQNNQNRYAHTINTLKGWAKTNGRINEKDIDDLLSQLDTKGKNAVSNDLKSAKSILKGTRPEPEKIQTQHKHFKSAAEKLQKIG